MYECTSEIRNQDTFLGGPEDIDSFTKNSTAAKNGGWLTMQLTCHIDCRGSTLRAPQDCCWTSFSSLEICSFQEMASGRGCGSQHSEQGCGVGGAQGGL